MNDPQIHVSFNELDDHYPDHMYGYWRRLLSNSSWEIYDILVTIAQTEGQFTTSLQRIVNQLGISKNKFLTSLRELESYGFVRVLED